MSKDLEEPRSATPESCVPAHPVESEARPSALGMSRRELLLLGGKGALGAAAVSATALATRGIPRSRVPGGVPRSPGQRAVGALETAAVVPAGPFKTAPQLVPPRLQVTESAAPVSAGLLMMTPSLLPTSRMLSDAQAVAQGKGQMGVMIADAKGEPVWFHRTGEMATNLQVQRYRGEPVLTYWSGKVVNGIGYGTGYVLDTSYRRIGAIRGGNGLQVDLHELTLTPQATALVSAYRVRPADTSAIGGTKTGSVYEGVVQEIDVATGKVVFEWNSLDHVTVGESYVKAGKGPVDYFHLNSVALWDDTSLIISARSTWAGYLVDRRTGAVIWRLGGKKSSFKIGKGANFEWQHHIRRYGSDMVTVFDDGATPVEEPASRALVLEVDTSARTVELVRAAVHPARLLSDYEGSVQALSDGHLFVGWGTEPYSSEFDARGDLVCDYRFPTNVQSYRAFRYEWSGMPPTPPNFVVEPDEIGGYALYVSWNGATEVALWQVLSGEAPGALEPVATVPRAGFETAVTVHPTGPYLTVAALDAKGRRLGVAKTVKL